MIARLLVRLLPIGFFCIVQLSWAVAPEAGRQAGGEVTWTSLSAEQQLVLAPLARTWPSLSLNQRQEWVQIAARYPRLKRSAQQRLQERMTEWAHMSTAQRRLARKNFQASRNLSASRKAQAWDAYQALPEEQKRALAHAAAKNEPKTIVSASPSLQPAAPQLKEVGKRKSLVRRPVLKKARAVGLNGSDGRPLSTTPIAPSRDDASAAAEAAVPGSVASPHSTNLLAPTKPASHE